MFWAQSTTRDYKRADSSAWTWKQRQQVTVTRTCLCTLCRIQHKAEDSANKLQRHRIVSAILLQAETGMVQACHAPRQSLQHFPSENLRGWATPWSVKEMLDGQRERAEVPACARTAHDDFPQKKARKESLLNHPSCPHRQPSRSRDWTELNYILLYTHMQFCSGVPKP